MDKDENKSKIDTTIEVMKYKSTYYQKANENLGITQEYSKENRDKLWDSQKRKSEYKEKVFGDKNTYRDPISGQVLHKNQEAAKRKYHMKNADGENISKEWAKHSAETDHINSIKATHNVVKHNPFLTDEDFKEIINSDQNYRVTSKKLNTMKGDKSDLQVIFDKKIELSKDGKIQMAKEKITADISVQGKFAQRTAENMGKEFAVGARDTLIKSAISLSVEAINNMCKVASGEISIEEASESIGKSVVKQAVIGGTDKLKKDIMYAQMSKNKILYNLANSNKVNQIVMVASIVKDSAIRYVNGEIDEEQFIKEIGEKGTTMVVSMIGGEIGRLIGASIGTAILPVAGTAAAAIIGEVIGVFISTVACTAIMAAYSIGKDISNTIKHLDDYKIKEHEIKILEAEALKEIENQRNKFKRIVEKEYGYWDQEIQKGFDLILSNACEETFNLRGITEGLDKILNIFGKSVAFKNIEEYEAQLDMPLKLKF